MPNFYTNQDDPVSDPDSIYLKSLVGKSPFFEVELTLAELSDRFSGLNLSSGNSSAALGSIGYIGDGSVFQPGCPTLSQYIYTEDKIVQAKDLLKYKSLKLWDPVENCHNSILVAELRKGVPIVQLLTTKGFSTTVSNSHLVVTSVYDRNGTNISTLKPGDPILSLKDGIVVPDYVAEITPLGLGDIVYLELEKRHLYSTSDLPEYAICAHNARKAPEI